MSLKTAYSRERRLKNHWGISVLALLIALLVVPQPGNTKPKKGNNHKLPTAPDTGSPQEDFAAGGTRDERFKNSVCGVDEQQTAYLLGNKNREFTASAHPTFWFYLPHSRNEIAQMKFLVTELETGKKIYNRVIQGTKESGIIGISLPKEKQYTLSPKVNYIWSLQVDCGGNRESEIALAGWVYRIPLNVKLQNRLAAASDTEKVAVYLKHNLLYDALTQQAQSLIAKPSNIQEETAWNQLLTTLGWQDLVEQKSNIDPSWLDTQISSQRKFDKF